MRVSINQDLIDQVKLYTFPPPHDTRVAQQAFIFSGGGAETSPSSVPAAAADDSSPPEAAAAVSAARDSGKRHFEIEISGLRRILPKMSCPQPTSGQLKPEAQQQRLPGACLWFKPTTQKRAVPAAACQA